MLIKKIRSLAKAKRAVILSHDNPDPDSIAASWGLSRLIRQEMGLPSVISYSGLIGRAENREMVRVLRIPLVPFSLDLIDDDSGLILIDCQPYTGNSALPAGIVPDIVIDHHPQRETTRYRQWAYINDKLGAISTYVARGLKESGHPLPKKLATALFYAIRTETKDLGWERTRQDYDSYIYLLPQVDFNALYRISHPPLSSAYYHSLKRAIDKCRLFRSLATCPLGPLPYPELPAEIADFLIFKDDVEFSFVWGHYKTDIFLSLRSLRPDSNSGELIQKIVEGLGRGGGHGITAGGKISQVSRSKLREMELTLQNRALKVFSIKRARPRKLY